MKKVKLVMVTALALVLFAGCKQKPQEEFTAELAKQSEMNAGSYSIVIDKMTISGEGEDSDGFLYGSEEKINVLKY